MRHAADLTLPDGSESTPNRRASADAIDINPIVELNTVKIRAPKRVPRFSPRTPPAPTNSTSATSLPLAAAVPVGAIVTPTSSTASIVPKKAPTEPQTPISTPPSSVQVRVAPKPELKLAATPPSTKSAVSAKTAPSNDSATTAYLPVKIKPSPSRRRPPPVSTSHLDSTQSASSTKKIATRTLQSREVSSRASKEPVAQTYVDWDECRAALTRVRLSTERAPKLFGISIRWMLMTWGLLLTVLDTTTFMSSFVDAPFLRFVFHRVALLPLPAGPSLVFLMASERFSVFWWRTHLSCQFFRLFLNCLLALDYYGAWRDELDTIGGYFLVQGDSNIRWGHASDQLRRDAVDVVRVWTLIFGSVLVATTMLSASLLGFAINVYGFERNEVRKRQEAWRRRLTDAVEAQGVTKDVAQQFAAGVMTTGSCRMIMDPSAVPLGPKRPNS